MVANEFAIHLHWRRNVLKMGGGGGGGGRRFHSGGRSQTCQQGGGCGRGIYAHQSEARKLLKKWAMVIWLMKVMKPHAWSYIHVVV